MYMFSIFLNHDGDDDGDDDDGDDDDDDYINDDDNCWIPHALCFIRGHRGYYMTARGYEFYLRVFNSISHE